MITSDFPPTVSGISTYYYNLLKYFPPEAVTVLCPWVEGCEAFDGSVAFRVIRIRCDTGGTIKSKLRRMVSLCVAAFGILMREPIRKVHCGQMVSNGVFACALHMLLGMRYYVYLHGGDGEKLRRYRYVNSTIRAVINRSNLTFTNSQSTKDEFVGIGTPARKMEVVTPSVDPTLFTPQIDGTRVRRKFGLEDKRIVLTVARLGAIKGHDRIIRALPAVVKEAPNVVYLIAGDGPERPRLEQLVDECGTRDHVVFAGYVPDEELPEYYAACDVFAMTSIQVPNQDVEGFGIVYLEASACGKPVIGSRTGGVAEAVADGESGLLVDPSNQREIEQVLVRLLSDEAYARQLGEQGRARVEREFSWERSSARLRALLRGR